MPYIVAPDGTILTGRDMEDFINTRASDGYINTSDDTTYYN